MARNSSCIECSDCALTLCNVITWGQGELHKLGSSVEELLKLTDKFSCSNPDIASD